MSSIGRFLQAKEKLFDQAIYQLDALTGRHGADVKLATEMAEKAAAAMRELELDPAAATGLELYGALIARVKRHDDHLARAIGGADPSLLSEMLPLIIKAARRAPTPKTGWFLKEDRARAMLRATPPPAVMARLGHVDADAMLATEDVFEIMLSLRFVESPDWLKNFNDAYVTLKPADFESRTIRIVPFSAAKWGDVAEHFIAKKRHNITHSKEMGAIAVMPLVQERMTGVTLKVLPLLCHYFNEIRLYSSYFKLIQKRRDFGRVLADTLNADLPLVHLVDHGHVHWRVIQRYYGKLTGEKHPEVFEPHLQPEDLHWRRAEEVLYEIDPELKFWRGMDYVATRLQDEDVTFNLMDVSLSYSNAVSYDDRYLYHFREALWNEVFARYMGEPMLEKELLEKLDNAIVEPEKLVAASENLVATSEKLVKKGQSNG
jgi:hypothetical protein